MDQPTILVINPNTSQEMTAAIDRVAQATVGTQAKAVTLCSQQGPHTIEGPLDAALGTVGMLEVVGAYTAPFDAAVVACFGDPGVDALRMLVRVPVVGIGAASFTQAAFMSQHFAIVTPSSRMRCITSRMSEAIFRVACSFVLADATTGGDGASGAAVRSEAAGTWQDVINKITSPHPCQRRTSPITSALPLL